MVSGDRFYQRNNKNVDVFLFLIIFLVILLTDTPISLSQDEELTKYNASGESYSSPFDCYREAPAAAGVDDLILMIESFPPFNFEENGELKGIAVELAEKMLRLAGSRLTRKDIRQMPWSRAYRDALETENTVLFLINRNPAREKLFKWVGPVAPIPIKYVLIAKKERRIRITSPDDLKKYRIGVVFNDLSEQLAAEMGIEDENIDPVSSGEINLLKLNRNRIDLWNYEANVAKWLITHFGFKMEDYEVVYILKKELPTYFAFHRNTPDKIIQKFQRALDELRKTPPGTMESELDKIVKKYIKKSPWGL